MSKCHKINCKLNGIMMTSADIVVRFYKLLHDIIDKIIKTTFSHLTQEIPHNVTILHSSNHSRKKEGGDFLETLELFLHSIARGQEGYIGGDVMMSIFFSFRHYPSDK